MALLGRTGLDKNEVRFTSEGADCDPYIVVTGSPLILWRWDDGTTDNVANPGNKVWGSVATRNHSVESDWKVVTEFRLEADNISKIDNLELLISLTHLVCNTNSISVLDVSALTSLTILHCYSNSISVLDVSNLTSLTYLHCSLNSISVLDVSALTALTTLHCYSNSISSLSVSALTALKTLNCHNNGMSATNVDNILIDLDTAGASNGTASLAGTNAARTSASDAAKANLLGRGWTITVNE